MKGWERAINTLSVRRPQPHNTNPRKKEEKGKALLIFIFQAHFTSFHVHSLLLDFFFCFIVVFHSCSHAQLLGDNIVHEVHIFYVL